MILIKIEKCGHCFYCIYRNIIEYRDNFLDNNREIFFLISPNPSVKLIGEIWASSPPSISQIV